jgi:hypothetical protein
MRLCRADLPASRRLNRGWKPLPQRLSSPTLQLREKDGQIRGPSRWLVHNAG